VKKVQRLKSTVFVEPEGQVFSIVFWNSGGVSSALLVPREQVVPRTLQLLGQGRTANAPLRLVVPDWVKAELQRRGYEDSE
jgi:hypothetical protein